MSPLQLRTPSPSFLVIPTTILAIVLFISNPVFGCTCMEPEFPRVFNSSDFAAIIKIDDEGQSSPKMLPFKQPVDSQQQGHSNTPIHSTRTSASITREEPCQPSSIRFPNLMTRKNTHSQPSFSDFFHPGTLQGINFQLPQRAFSSFSSSTHEGNNPTGFNNNQGKQNIHPYPYLAETMMTSQLIGKMKSSPAALHEREEVATVTPSPARQQKSYLYQLVQLVKVTSNKVKQLIAEGTAYTNPQSTCYANLQKNGKYLVWGRVIQGKIHLTSCNTIRFDTLTQEERKVIEKLIKERDQSGSENSKNNTNPFKVIRRST